MRPTLRILLPVALALCSHAFGQASADPFGVLRKPIPDKLVVLTFDDGVASHATVVAPILKQHGFGGSFYVCDFDSFNTRKDWYLSWDQIRTMSNEGFDMGNHTLGHAGGASISPFLGMDREFAANGVPKPTTLAWPVFMNNPATTPDLVANHYTFGRGGVGRTYVPTMDDPFNIPCSFGFNGTYDSFVSEAKRAINGRIMVFTFHGVPEGEHMAVSCDPVAFAAMMQYLKENHYKVISLRDLDEYVDPARAATYLPSSVLSADITISDTSTIAATNTFTSTTVTCNVTVAGTQKTFGGTGSGWVAVTGTIGGSASLVQNAPYVLELRPSSGSNTLGGVSVMTDSVLRSTAKGLASAPITLTNGTLQLEDPLNASENFASPVTVVGANTVQARDNHRGALTGKMTGSGSVTYSGYFPVSRISSDSDYSGATRLAQDAWHLSNTDESQGLDDCNFGIGGSKPFGSGGVLTIAGSGGTRVGIAYTASGTPVISNNVVLETPLALSYNNSTYGIDLAGTISGTGSLVKVFAAGDTGSTLHLRGNNTYSGGTRFLSGNLNFYQASAFGSGTVTLGGKINASHALSLRNQSALTVANAFEFAGITEATITGSSATFAGVRGTTYNNLAAQAEFNTAGGNLTLTGALSGSGGLLKSGANKLTLSGTNTYSGPTKVAAGTLSCSSATSLGSGALEITSGAVLDLNFSGTRAVASLTLNGAAKAAGIYGPLGSTTATYKSADFTGAGTVTVLPTSNTALALTGGATPAALGEPLSFTAAVTGSTPTGAVTFYAKATQVGTPGVYSGAVPIGTSALNGSYQASLTISTLLTGLYDITASYGGDANNRPGTTATSVSIKVGFPLVPKDFLSFDFPGLGGAVFSDTTLSLTVPYTTVVTALAPTYTVSPGASAGPGSGSIRDFSSPQTYTVTGQDGVTKTYTVKVNRTAASSAREILTMTFPGSLSATISGTTIGVNVPAATNVAALAPTFTLPTFATANFASGTSRDFTSPQTYVITAQNGSTQTYTVTVTKSGTPAVFTWTNAVAGNWSDATKWTNNLATGTAPGTAGQADGVLNFNGAASYTTTNDLSTGFLLNQLNFGTGVTVAGNPMSFTANPATGTLPGINQNSSSDVTMNAPIHLASNTTVGGSGNAAVQLNSLISGPGSLIKSGSNWIRMNDFVNTYSGGTVVKSGGLYLYVANKCLGTGPLTLEAGATLSLEHINGTNPLILNGGLIEAGNGFGDSWSGTITLNGTPQVAAYAQFDITANMSGAGGFTQIGPMGGFGRVNSGLVNLSGTNTYTGPTTVFQGTMTIKKAASLYNADTPKWSAANIRVYNAMSLRLNVGGSGEFTGAQIGTLLENLTTGINNNGLMAGSNFIIDTTNASGTVVIPNIIKDSQGTGGGAFHLRKSGGGTTQLTGANTYTGKLVIDGGTLSVASINSVVGGTSSSNLGAPTTVDTGTLTFTNTGGLTYTGTGETTDRVVDFAGGDSTLTFTQAGTGLIKFSSPFTMTSYGTNKAIVLTGSTAGTGEIAGNILNPAAAVTSLTKSGSGTWTLSGTNSYSGQTTISGGMLVCANAMALGGGILSIGSGAKLQLNAGTRAIAKLILNGTGMAAGTYGSSASTAANKNDTYFAGPGTVSVGVPTAAATTTALDLPSGYFTSAMGTPMTFTAKVASGTPTGNVTFYAGNTALGTRVLNGSAVASLTTSSLTAGAYLITAQYEGTASYQSSLSSAIIIRVNNASASNDILTFVFPGLPAATISGSNISVTVPNATNVTSLAPIYTVSAGAAGDPVSGTARDFSTPQSYTISAPDLTPHAYTVTVNIAPPNRAPVALAQSLTCTEAVAKPITLAATDADGDPLTYAVLTQPAHGTLDGTAPNLIYTATSGYNGPDVFTFKANDGLLDSAAASISLTVKPSNRAPVATAQNPSTAEDTALAITLAATDADGDPLTYAIVAQPAHGTLSGSAPNITYTPALNYNGTDSFTFKANDGLLDSAAATVSLTVTPVNDAPVATPQSVGIVMNAPKAIPLSGTDVDGDPLTYSIVSQPAHGSLTGSPPNMTYRPANNYSGSDSFTFKANDGALDSAAVLVSLTVGSQAPTVVTFSKPGTTTWTAPDGVTAIKLLVVAGGGGGGGSGTNGGACGGGGAGGLKYYGSETPAVANSFTVTPGQTYNITVGAGGAVHAS
ncbi:MAG: Ig-like domain-containing protein, partial [Verrucomicrobiota bacterium]